MGGVLLEGLGLQHGPEDPGAGKGRHDVAEHQTEAEHPANCQPRLIRSPKTA